MLKTLRRMLLTTGNLNVAGRLADERISLTKAGANVAGAGALWAILPQVAEGNPAAIGQFVLLLLGWVGVLLGRWRAEG